MLQLVAHVTSLWPIGAGNMSVRGLRAALNGHKRFKLKVSLVTSPNTVTFSVKQLPDRVPKEQWIILLSAEVGLAHRRMRRLLMCTVRPQESSA